MGIFACCFAPTTEPEQKQPQTRSDADVVPPSKQQDAETVFRADSSHGSAPAAADSDWSKSWSKLNQSETTAVKQTLLKVSELIERFAEGSAEREAPLHALKKALQLVASDCHASYASMSVMSQDQQSFLVMGAVGSSHEAATLPNIVTAVAGSDSSVERVLRAPPAVVETTSSISAENPAVPAAGGNVAMNWSVDDVTGPPSDWVQLQNAGIRHIHAMPIRAGPDVLLGVLNLGFKHKPCVDMGSMGPHLFGTYLSLISATLTAVVRDPGLNAYVCLARDIAAATTLDGIMQAALLGSRVALTRWKGLAKVGSGAGGHTWLRLALISDDKSAAALFDDLSQAGVARSNKRSIHSSGSSAQWVATIQAAGGLVRTNIPMKNTILRIALTNKKQVLIPDVQKLINQLGNVNTDLFASRLLRPPSSVLLLPLRASGVGIFGALYCLADVQTEFGEVAKQLKEVAELLGSGLNRQLSGLLAFEYLGIQQLTHEQLLAKDTTNESGHSLGGTTGGHSSGIYGSITSSTVTPATTAGSLPTGYSTTGSSSLTGGPARSEGSFMAAATAGGAVEFGSTIGTHASWNGSLGGSLCSAGGSMNNGAGILGRSFTTRQMASSTNAVATGITEKLNQKRIDASMHEPEEDTLSALQLIAMIGEGGFAKVFRGLYRGLVVAVKIVTVGDPSNERAVMKNAHEIAILRSSSHPNIIQAYSCLTDVHVRDLVALCTRQAPRQQRAGLIAALTTSCTNRNSQTPAAAAAADDATCHVQVVEYCDLGNLTTAIRSMTFNMPPPGSSSTRRSRHTSKQSSGQSGTSTASPAYDSEDASCGTVDSSLTAGSAHAGSLNGAQPGTGGPVPATRLRVNMRWLLLTLLEIAEGMAYLHRMGVVHCDLKPANVLLRSNNSDVRGFTTKVSDFGLSRVEDDDTCATFPFNSCGTAAYVAPEALITTKKVNASVDVYAFGIMMWELFVGQRPYGNMSQQKVVEEVVLRGLRPSFPAGTPPGYTQLAVSCWHATAGARPTFQEVTARLQAMLHMAEESDAAAAASCSLTGSEAWGGRADAIGTPAMVAAASAAAAAASAQRGAGSIPPSSAAAAAAGGGVGGRAPGSMGSQRGVLAGAHSGGNGHASTSAAAAAAIAEAAAAWGKQCDATGRHPSVGGSGGGGSSTGSRVKGNPQQVQVQQLLAWQQQQQLLQQQYAAAGAQQQQQQLMHAGPFAKDPAARAAAMASGVDRPLQQQQMVQDSSSSHSAAAKAGSVYEYQQVGFGGESVVGTGTITGSRLGSTARSTSATANGSRQQQQLLEAAAAAGATGGSFSGMYSGQQHPSSRRPPVRSKTFTAGQTLQQQQQQHMNSLLAAGTPAAAAAALRTSMTAGSSFGDGTTSGTGTSLSFGYAAAAAASEDGDKQQQQLLMLQQQGGFIPGVGVIAGQQQLQSHQHQQQQQQFAFSTVAGSSGASANSPDVFHLGGPDGAVDSMAAVAAAAAAAPSTAYAAAAAAAMKQQQAAAHQQQIANVENAARELLVRQQRQQLQQQQKDFNGRNPGSSSSSGIRIGSSSGHQSVQPLQQQQ